jgi:hypothetical protein
MDIIQIPQELKDVSVVAQYATVEIQNDFDAQVATDRLGEIKTKKAQIETLKETFLKPQKRVILDLEAQFRDALKPFTEVENIIRKKLGAYMDAVRAQKQKEAMEAQKKLLEEQRKKADELAKQELISGESSILLPLVEANIKSVEAFKPEDLRQTIKTSDATTVTQSLIWCWEVEDITKVPLDYLMIDERKVNAMAKLDSGRSIPGIKYFQKTRVGVR